MTPKLLYLSSETSLEARSSFVHVKFSCESRSIVKKFSQSEGMLTVKLERLPEEKNLAQSLVALAFLA